MTKIIRDWTSAPRESFTPYAYLEGDGLTQPLDNNHTTDWAANTTGFTICYDTDSGDEYVYETVKTENDVYYRQLFAL